MDILAIIINLIIVIYSSVFHEIAHGYVAYRLGDPTAKLLGRFSLNPRSHIDPWMSIAMPIITFITSGIMFGGAKPVPVDVFNLRDGIKDLAIVSLVGPMTNAALAIIASLLIHLFYPGMGFNEVGSSGLFGFILAQIVRWNIILAIFNLIPIPPLDGSKVVAAILPEKEAAAYLSMGSIGLIFIMFLLFFPIGGFSLFGIISALMTFALSILGF